MIKHWHKTLFDFEQSLFVNSITQLLNDFSAYKFIKHHEKKISSHLKDINLGESTPKLIPSSSFFLILSKHYRYFISKILKSGSLSPNLTFLRLNIITKDISTEA
jgi:hypothetical protein